MTLASERELDVQGSQYSSAMNLAALADIVTTVLRSRLPVLAHPEDRVGKTFTWTSSAYVDPSGVRLRRFLLVDRWSSDRELAESHNWYGLGESSIYELPLTTTVIMVGQFREGKFHSPFSKGFLHPVSRTLRIKKRDGESFNKNWTSCWREEQDWLSRDKWIDTMRADHVLNDVVFDVDLDLPHPMMMDKVKRLAESKLKAIALTQELPEPRISQCDWPVPCEFRDCCWSFREPSERTGFISRF